MERLDGELGQQLQALRDVAPDPRRVDEIVSATTAWRAWREETRWIDEAGDQPAAYRRLLEGSATRYTTSSSSSTSLRSGATPPGVTA